MSFRELVERTVSTYQVKCSKCSLSKINYVPSSIVPGSQISIVGMAPDATDVEQRTPFVGLAGRRLRNTLKSVGLPPESISYHNVISCRPPDNAMPEKSTVKLCGDKHLRAELSSLKPKLIVTLGPSAYSYFMSTKMWARNRGNFIRVGNQTILPTWHPSYVNRLQHQNPEEYRLVESAFARDLDKARRFVDGSLYADRHYHIVTDIADAKKWSDFLCEQPILACDIENYPLHFWEPEAEMLTISFCWQKGHAVCFPLDHFEIEDEQVRAANREAVGRVLATDSVKLWHNIKHDVPWLRHFGYKVNGRQICTMIVAYLTDENRKSYGLKQLSATYLNGYLDLLEPTRFVPLDRMGFYNCEDTDNTLQLLGVFRKQMTPKLWQVHDELMVPGAFALNEAERVGVYLDVPYLKSLMKSLQSEVDQQIAAANKQMPKGRVVTSSDDLRFEFFERRKLEVVSLTPKGAPQIDAKVLKVLDEDRGIDLAGDILAIRKKEKLLNTYLRPYPDFADQNSRIHCSFMLTATVTGRLSARNPGLHQIPRDKRIRMMICAEKGNVLIYGDLATAEMRVAGSLANDRTMIDIFRRGLDVHLMMGAQMGGIKPEEMNLDNPVHKKFRQDAKPVNFGLLYGQMPPGLQSYARYNYGTRFSLKQCEKFREMYFDIYRDLPAWYAQVHQKLYRDRFVETELGRRRRFPGLFELKDWERHEAERQAVNTLVQSLTSDLMLKLFIATQQFLVDGGFKTRLILTVHDSLMGEGPEEEVADIARFIDSHVAAWKFDWLKVPMLIDLEKVNRWGEKGKLEKGVHF